MSTTFAIKLPDSSEPIDVAHRRCGEIVWVDNIGPTLPEHMEVIPTDNSAQGIRTIKDIKDAMEDGKICR